RPACAAPPRRATGDAAARHRRRTRSPRSPWIPFSRHRLLSFRQRRSVAGPDDERPVLRVVEVRRVRRLVAPHAPRGGDFRPDVLGRVLDVLAAGSVTRLALHVAPACAAAVDAGAPEVRHVDAADAAGLLPAGDVAGDAVEAELLF